MTQMVECTTESLVDTDLIHSVCECDENVALCGLDMTGHDWLPEGTTTCVVCYDLDELPCSRCGH